MKTNITNLKNKKLSEDNLTSMSPNSAAQTRPLLDILKQAKPYLLFAIIFAIGVLVRVWKFGEIPPGTNPDETSIGIEAYYLLKYGIDRNGISYPVHLISWGSGQNALYAYLLLPLVWLNGLNAESIRLPMLFSGILSMPLIYLAGKKILGGSFGLLAMFLMAISPWHIINSRWAVESNILPFVFLTGFVFLLYSNPKNIFFVFACMFFALSLYAYGTAYAAIPVFLSISIPLLIYTKRVTGRQAATGLVVCFLLSLPIILFVVVNTLNLNTIQLGRITIPRLPVEARYESLTAMFDRSPLDALLKNAKVMIDLLWNQSDIFPSSHVEPFGYFYKVTFPLALAGVFMAFPINKSSRENSIERWLLLAWLLASIFIGLIQPVNLTRINLIFTPLLLYIAIFLFEINKRVPYSLEVGVFILLIGFVFFNKAYYGEEYQKRLRGAFNLGIIPSIEYATNNSKGAVICLTETLPSAYVYVLYSQKPHPSEYTGTTEWIYPYDYPFDPARFPRVLGKYHFQISDCSDDSQSVYILDLTESPPNEADYKIKRFDKYRVYLPKK